MDLNLLNNKYLGEGGGVPELVGRPLKKAYFFVLLLFAPWELLQGYGHGWMQEKV